MDDEQQNGSIWDRSAVEALVLLTGPQTSDLAAVRMAMLELVVRHAYVLRAVPRRRLLLFRRPCNVLSSGPNALHEQSPCLKPVVHAYQNLRGRNLAGTRDGIAVDAIAREAIAAYRPPPRNRRSRAADQEPKTDFVDMVVLPELARAGYYTRSQGGSIDSTWVLTPSGHAKLEQLRNLMQEGRGSFREWVHSDPERARRFVEQAGPVMLLLTSLVPPLCELHQTHPHPERSYRAGSRATSLGRFFAPAALAGIFGPGLHDTLDASYYAISEDVERAWILLAGSAGFGIGE